MLAQATDACFLDTQQTRQLSRIYLLRLRQAIESDMPALPRHLAPLLLCSRMEGVAASGYRGGNRSS
jgi:hypothetical protein